MKAPRTLSEFSHSLGPRARIAAATATRARLERTGEAAGRSELDLLRQAQRIVDLDPEIADHALNLRVSEKQLDCSQIAGLAVDLRRLSSTQRMRAVGPPVHSGAFDPAIHDACVLASRQMGLVVDGSERQRGLELAGARSASLAAKLGSVP